MRPKASPAFLAPLALVIALCVCRCAQAATLRVPSEYATIQAAINAASPGDTVAVAPGTYAGPGFWVIRFFGKALTLRSEAGPESTILDGQFIAAPIFLFRDQETNEAVVDGFTVANAYGFEQSGGGFLIYSGSSPTIKNCLIAGNRVVGEFSGQGGGIAVRTGSAPVFENCTISGNFAFNSLPYPGSNLHVHGSTVHLVRSVIYGNCGQSGVTAHFGSTIYFDCSVVDTSRVRTQSGGVVEYVGENVFADPIFCGAEPCPETAVDPLDYRVDAASPCLPQNNPCEVLIGALGLGCPPAAVHEPRLRGGIGSVSWVGPNPASRHVRIELDLSLQPETVGGRVFDLLGKQVGAIHDRRLGPGIHHLEWPAVGSGGTRLPAGVYFLKLRVGRSEETHSFVIAR